jgi:hypothetical protein
MKHTYKHRRLPALVKSLSYTRKYTKIELKLAPSLLLCPLEKLTVSVDSIQQFHFLLHIQQAFSMCNNFRRQFTLVVPSLYMTSVDVNGFSSDESVLGCWMAVK